MNESNYQNEIKKLEGFKYRLENFAQDDDIKARVKINRLVDEITSRKYDMLLGVDKIMSVADMYSLKNDIKIYVCVDEGFVHLRVEFHKMDYQNLKEFMGYLIQFCKFRFDENFMDNHKTLELKFKPVKDTLNLDFIDNYIPIEKD